MDKLALCLTIPPQAGLIRAASSQQIQLRICKCVGMYGSCRCLHTLRQCCLAAWFIIWVWQHPLNAGISFPFICSLKLSAVVGMTGGVSAKLSSPGEYCSSKADQGCDISESGHCMRSARYALAPICCVFHIFFLFLSVSAEVANLHFLSLFIFFLFLFPSPFLIFTLVNCESLAAITGLWSRLMFGVTA